MTLNNFHLIVSIYLSIFYTFIAEEHYFNNFTQYHNLKYIVMLIQIFYNDILQRRNVYI